MTRAEKVEERVLVLAPVGRDAPLACAVLESAGLTCEICSSMAEVCRGIVDGAGCLLLTEEALDCKSVDALLEALAREPDWSDLPVTLFISDPRRLPPALERLSLRRSLSVQERPVSKQSLITVMRAAVRARVRQYQLRDLLLHLEDLNENLEGRVHDRTAELEYLNRELESFSYSISHDLRAPLRAINGFSRLILDDYGDQFDETVEGYFQRIRSASTQMGRLIDDLLKLSRISSGEIRMTSVDLSSMADSIARQLQEHEPQRDVLFHIAPSIEARGDENLLRIVLHNLLENAWKFTAKRDRGEIYFGVNEESTTSIFFLRDNGAGFDMRYSERLFTPFQRLHDGREFEGTGIGLAIVNRIVARHGGRIWAESAPDAGTTFYFTLRDS